MLSYIISNIRAHTSGPSAHYRTVAGPDFCASCVCSVVDAFMPVFSTAGADLPEPGSPDYAAKAAGLVAACTTDFITPMVVAGVNVSSLISLSSCDFTGAAPHFSS